MVSDASVTWTHEDPPHSTSGEQGANEPSVVVARNVAWAGMPADGRKTPQYIWKDQVARATFPGDRTYTTINPVVFERALDGCRPKTVTVTGDNAFRAYVDQTSLGSCGEPAPKEPSECFRRTFTFEVPQGEWQRVRFEVWNHGGPGMLVFRADP